MTFSISGTSITGEGKFAIACGTTSEETGSLLARGTVQPDGSFTVQQIPDVSLTPSFTLSGTAPSQAGGAWSGTYTLSTALAITGCAQSVTDTFSATAIPEMTGTFSGSASITTAPVGGQPTASNVSFSTTLTQDNSSATNPSYVTGTLSVTGSPCFTSGTITGPPSIPSNPLGSYVSGGYLTNWYQMNDGSLVELTGSATDTSGKQLFMLMQIISPGACQTTLKGGALLNVVTLTRQ